MSSSSLHVRGSPVVGAVGRLLRAWGRRILGRALAPGLERVARLSSRRVGLALVYHRIGNPAGDPRSELLPALSPSLFAGQLGHLASRYRLVPASELVAATRRRRNGERFPVAITFDDDDRSHLDVAAPILRSAEAPATFFLTGASLDGPHAFWWELLQIAYDRGLDLAALEIPSIGDDATVHQLGRAIEAMTPARRASLTAALEALVGSGPADTGLRAEDVALLAGSGFEIGFHTLGHDPLTSLEPDALEHAMQAGRGDLEQVVGGTLSSIAYPHGRANTRVAQAARSAGFEVGFTGLPEPVTPASDPLLLGRLSPSYRSVGELAFDVAAAIFRASSPR